MDNDSINWTQTHRRLEAIEEAIEFALNPPESVAQTIMDDRAAKLAEAPEDPPRPEEMIELMTFNIGDDAFAIETRYIRTVLQIDHITPVPNTPDLLAGVICSHGEVLAVVDFRLLFNFGREQARPLHHLIVIGEDRAEYAFMVQAVYEVREMTRDQIGPASSTSSYADLVQGLTPNGVTVLDVTALLNDSRLMFGQWFDEA